MPVTIWMRQAKPGEDAEIPPVIEVARHRIAAADRAVDEPRQAAAARRSSASAGAWVRRAWPRKSSSAHFPSADLTRCRRCEFIVRHVQVLRRRPLPDARRGVVHRAVARAEIAAVRAAVLALADAERHAAEMGADAERDQPVLLARLGPLGERLRIAKLGQSAPRWPRRSPWASGCGRTPAACAS